MKVYSYLMRYSDKEESVVSCVWFRATKQVSSSQPRWNITHPLWTLMAKRAAPEHLLNYVALTTETTLTKRQHVKVTLEQLLSITNYVEMF